MTLHDFIKAAPEGFRPRPTLAPDTSYKYFVHGKGCTLGVLFEDSVNVYFEWVLENERPVDYPPEIRYKAWPKHEFARLMVAGVWHPTCAAAPAF